MSKKSNFNIGSVIILILLLQLVKQCHARDWLNQSTPNSIEKKIKRDQLIERLKKDPKLFEQPKGTPQNQTFPVHDYFLTKVGIHTLENLNLKKLANESVYESCTMILPLKSKGSAGSPIRPVAIGKAG